MSVQLTTSVQVDARYVYDELPKGVQPWTALRTSTGNNTGGDVRVQVNFNPDSLAGFQRYVSVVKIAVHTSVAAPPPAVEMSLGPNDWERSATNVATPLVAFPILVTVSSVIGQGVYDIPTFLGRTLPSTLGGVRFATENVDLMVTQWHMAGFISDRPFLTNFNWRI